VGHVERHELVALVVADIEDVQELLPPLPYNGAIYS